MAKDKKKPETIKEVFQRANEVHRAIAEKEFPVLAGEMPFPSREAAMEALEKSTLSDAEKERLSEPITPVADDHATHLDAYKAIAPPGTAMSGATVQAHLDAHQSLAPVTDAVARLEEEAWDGINRVDRHPIDPLAEKVRSFALPGESLVQAVERLEALARAVSTLSVGLIVQETAPSMYKVHVVESDAEGVRVWDTEPGKAMPWHAAKVLVDRVVETKLTPEDKR